MNTDSPTPENDANLSALGRALFETGGSKPSTGPWVPPTAEELHAILPQYEIVKMLGRGGMGAVYMGTQTALERPVAIKILSAQLEESDMGFTERFKNEAKAMAKLNHPGIVAVYDFGEAPGGLLYIVMEYVDGTDVAKMIAKSGRLHTEHAMAITAHVCDALAYAHERGIIHRDIKPANIMVGYDGEVKVADFGLAKVNVGGKTLGLTMSGMAMGTMHYMAPEALMLGTSVDHRADIYAVGVMLYQMLTGKLPQGMFKLPSLLVPGLDPRYDAIVRKALMEDRESRYQSIREMRAELDSILSQPVLKVEPAASAAEAKAAALPTSARPQRPGGRLPAHPASTSAQTISHERQRGSFAWLWVTLLVLAVFGGVAWVMFGGPNAEVPAQTSLSSPSASPAPTTSTTTASFPAPTTIPAVASDSSTSQWMIPFSKETHESKAPVPKGRPVSSEFNYIESDESFGILRWEFADPRLADDTTALISKAHLRFHTPKEALAETKAQIAVFLNGVQIGSHTGAEPDQWINVDLDPARIPRQKTPFELELRCGANAVIVHNKNSLFLARLVLTVSRNSLSPAVTPSTAMAATTNPPTTSPTSSNTTVLWEIPFEQETYLNPGRKDPLGAVQWVESDGSQGSFVWKFADARLRIPGLKIESAWLYFKTAAVGLAPTQDRVSVLSNSRIIGGQKGASGNTWIGIELDKEAIPFAVPSFELTLSCGKDGVGVLSERSTQPAYLKVMASVPAGSVIPPDPAGWISLFNGKDLSGWEAAPINLPVSVAQGMILIRGVDDRKKAGDLFYVGDGKLGNGVPQFKNFEVMTTLKTSKHGNSDLMIHAAPITRTTGLGSGGAGSAGIGVQIWNEQEPGGLKSVENDRHRTGSLWMISPMPTRHFNDDDWFNLKARVEDNRLQVWIQKEGAATWIQTADWTQPANWTPPLNVPQARLGSGTIAFSNWVPAQGEVWVKEVKFRSLDAAPTTPVTPAAATSITTPIETFNGHRYQFVPGALTWKEAKAKAESMGGHLATLTSKEENEWLLLTYRKLLTTPNRNIWLGASEEMAGVGWKWVTGEPFTPLGWFPGEPNGMRGGGGQVGHPFMLNLYSFRDNGVGWNDSSTHFSQSRDNIGFIVEWDTDKPSASPTSVAPTASSTLWIDTKGRSLQAKFIRVEGANVMLDIAGKATPVALASLSAASQQIARDLQASLSAPASIIPSDALTFGTSRYAYFPVTLTWAAAKAMAEVKGGHLATFTSAAEEAAVTAYLQSRLTVQELLHFWLGGYQASATDSWAWLTGEPFIYTHWAPSEPDNSGGAGERGIAPFVLDCLIDKAGARWHDFSSAQTNWQKINTGYLVEWDRTASANVTPVQPGPTHEMSN